ncbi:MAG: hypothetical protein KDE09_22285, partial [Anaerolineales bacterium]|nr:hypothetical protein [Anaerolineales bacterium]
PEATAFLNDVMGLRLSAANVQALETHTEGWIVGLQLAALSMQGRQDAIGFIEAFTGTNRYILDYLTDEVLEQWPSDIKKFLLQTSILDRLCGPLCDSLTGSSDGQATLEKLEQANLFIVPLDDKRGWFRYHHLFADVLRNRLEEENFDLLGKLHQTASAWFEQDGQPEAAIDHALAAEDWLSAARLISAHGVSLTLQGQSTLVTRWLDAVPRPVWQTQPHLPLIRAFIDAAMGQYAAVEPSLKQVEAILQTTPALDTPALRLEITTMRGIALSFLLDPSALAFVQSALQDSPPNHPRRVVLLIALANAYYASGYLQPARETLDQALALLASGPHDRLSQVSLGLHVTLIFVLLAQGHLRLAEQSAQNLLTRISPELQLSPGVALLHAQAGHIAYLRGLLAEAETFLTHSLELGRANDNYFAKLVALNYLAGLSQARGNYGTALTQLEQSEQLARTHRPDSAALKNLIGRRAHLWVQQDNLGAAANWATAYEASPPGDDALLTPFDGDRFVLARVWIAQQRWPAALTLLDQLLRVAQAGGHGFFRLWGLLLQAMAYHGQGDTDLAFTSLEHALTLAQPENYLRPFVDEGKPLQILLTAWRNQQVNHQAVGSALQQRVAYVDKILAAFPTAIAQPLPLLSIPNLQPPASSLVETLSRRELEVLHLIAAGYNNQEIADSLVVAVSTVKKHINNIFGKLAVNSRTQAVAQARSLGLIA